MLNSPLSSVTRNLIFCLNPSQRNFHEHVIMGMGEQEKKAGQKITSFSFPFNCFFQAVWELPILTVDKCNLQ